MLTSELRINGRLLGSLQIVNTGVREKGMTVYSVEYYRVGSGIVIRDTVLHRYDDGAEVLIGLAMDKISMHDEYRTMVSKVLERA